MDALLEKDIAVTKLKTAALNSRAQAALALAELINEYAQLTTVQQRVIDVLTSKIKSYEDKSVEPAGGTVSKTPFTAA
jgi:hypothetical protein